MAVPLSLRENDGVQVELGDGLRLKLRVKVVVGWRVAVDDGVGVWEPREAVTPLEGEGVQVLGVKPDRDGLWVTEEAVGPSALRELDSDGVAVPGEEVAVDRVCPVQL